MKKMLCVCLTAAMMLSNVVIGNAQTSFIDVPDNHWAAPYIEEMSEVGLISGYEDKTFRPDKDVSYLEGIVLFARAMGSNSEAMSGVLKYATEQYGDIVDQYNLAFGKNEVCYMLYRGALNTDELDKYLAADVRNTPMKRCEAATVITKAMAAVKEADKEILVDLSYKDATEIPAEKVKHVYFVTKTGIITGMDGNIFSPNTNVKRSQIAVMLSRTVGEMGLSFYEGTIKEINSAKSNITIEDSEFKYTSDTVMYNGGNKISVDEMPTNSNAIITTIRDKVCFVDVLDKEENLEGIFLDYHTLDGVLNIAVKNPSTEKTETFKCAENVKVMRNGESSSIINFKSGDVIKLTLVNGKATLISSEKQGVNINDAVVSDVSVGENVVIKISHAEEKYNGKTFDISNDVLVIRNEETKAPSDILCGDKVSLTLEYGQITQVVATSSKKTLEGKIKEMHIASKSQIVIEVDGRDQTYDVPASIFMNVNGNLATIYDCRIGDIVNLTVENQVTTSISVTSSNGSVHGITEGVVTAVDLSYGAIKVNYNNDGVITEELVVCAEGSNMTATILDANGKTLGLEDIKVGNVVSIRGDVKNGMFAASVVLIESN